MVGTQDAALDAGIDPALCWAHPLIQEWFTAKFGTPTEPQKEGWPAILRGETTLISAPTGSGKTLTAFLVCIDGLLRAALEGRLTPHTQVVYVSPLKALSNDVQKNLDGPLAEIQELARARGYLCPEIRTGVRTGDTLPRDRAAMLRHPPHILVTTPESLYILLTAGKSRSNLKCVTTVIVDEIHALADDKRGSHLALSLERLEALVCGENTLTERALRAAEERDREREDESSQSLAAKRAWNESLPPPQRIGLSATQNPISLVADFLTGFDSRRGPATLIQVGQRRVLDLAIEVPSDELGSITSIAMWTEVFDKLALLAEQHRSTLVFVNTRRLVEKISFELAGRLGPDAVAAHHGSLSRTLRLDAEQRLKAGEIKILIATASLELGIDIGNVDLVCQIATTRAVSVAMQRVGRAGHWRGAIPKGHFFALTRDDLMEQAALVRKMRAGELDHLEIPEAPIDVLMQQIVAMCGAESWAEEALYTVLRRAWPYRELTRKAFDEVLGLLHEGIVSTRGRYGAYLLRDRVNGHLHARRGARMIAIGNGGAIPDTSLFSVMLQPENVQIATLDEHFAVDSSPGDVVLLGNTSWRIQRIDPQGKVLVEDAHGAPPSIPFWEGEAPQRTAALCDGVSDLRAELDRRTCNVKPSDLRFASPAEGRYALERFAEPGGTQILSRKDKQSGQQQLLTCLHWLQEACCLSFSAAQQLIGYLVAGRAALGAVPTKSTIIAERFFDEGGGQQLVLHAPFGGRLNKAWGLALRKRFCRGFNFELQAAATDNGINISLAEQHSFPLADVFQFLSVNTARDLLEQAAIPSPLFKNRWRWAAGRSLQLLRMQKGKRVAPQIQRTRSDDLLASVFPHASACPETMTGDIVIPDHPLVREVMRDTLSEAMDINGLEDLLRNIASGAITCIAVDTPVPSLFAHELINAMPYSYLDDEDAAARRARAVSLRRVLPDAVADGAGRLDEAAIRSVRDTLWPDVRDEHEMHDLLLSLLVLPVGYLTSGSETRPRSTERWPGFLSGLEAQGRAFRLQLRALPLQLSPSENAASDPCEAWVAAERLHDAQLLWPEAELPERAEPVGNAREATTFGGTEYRPAQPVSPLDSAVAALVRGWLQVLGPTTAEFLGALVVVAPALVYRALLMMEMQGLALRGVFDNVKPAEDAPHATEWCERRILQRIHRLTLTGLRKAVEPVSPAVFMRWLLDWQHVAPDAQLSGEEGVLAALEQLEGFEAPAVEWERTLLPARVRDYSPRWLDDLCLAGVVAWGRISPHPAWLEKGTGEAAAPRRVIPTAAAPITFFLREGAEWLGEALRSKCVEEQVLATSLSPEARTVRSLLSERGAAFTADLQRFSGLGKLQVTSALWELATAGLASADGFDQLRAMMDPRRKTAAVEQTVAVNLRKRAAARTTAGRWSLFCNPVAPSSAPGTRPEPGPKESGLQKAGLQKPDLQAMAESRAYQASLEAHARVLLCRYGVVFRDLLARESSAPKWRDLAPVLRRLEERGELRGGRFVSGPFGEQFALPEAVEGLRAARRQVSARVAEAPLTVSAADPLNLVGLIVPGERVPAIPGREVSFYRGAAVQEETDAGVAALPRSSASKRSRSLAEIVRAEALPHRPARHELPSLFS